jgi:prevent-host-death family protein
MLEFRRNTEGVIRRLRDGQSVVLSYRGKPVARMEPIRSEAPGPGDPFYRLCELATERGERLTNADIDRIVCEIPEVGEAERLQRAGNPPCK